jgi:hypothetical protein
MPDDEKDLMTLAKVVELTGAKEFSVRQALTALGIQGKRYIGNRKYVVYPDDTPERVRKWIEDHS